MKKPYGILLGIGMLALSGNTAAIIITNSGNADIQGSLAYPELNHDLLLQIGAGAYFDNQPELKLARKVNKLHSKIDHYEVRAETRGLNTRQQRKRARLEDRLLLVLALMDLPDVSTLIPDERALPAKRRDNPPAIARVGTREKTVHRVPESSIISLLATGLIVIGAGRRLRQAV
jgi:hypothetical protein